MKITLGAVVIETDYIVTVIKKSPHTCEVTFITGSTLDIVCGAKTAKLDAGEFNGDSDQFLNYIENIDRKQREESAEEPNPRPENR